MGIGVVGEKCMSRVRRCIPCEPLRGCEAGAARDVACGRGRRHDGRDARLLAGRRLTHHPVLRSVTINNHPIYNPEQTNMK